MATQLNQLSAYTLSLGDKEFLHQLVVDTYAAQHPEESGKPIRLAFALIGLYLAFEKGYSGRQVQTAHMIIAKKTKSWPTFETPEEKSSITLEDVLKTTPGEARNQMIKKWGKSVWSTWRTQHQKVEGLVNKYI